MIEKKEIGMCPLCETKYDLGHTFCGNDGHQLEQRTLLIYDGIEYMTYQGLYAGLTQKYIKTKFDEYLGLVNEIKDDIREEKNYLMIKYWKTLNIEFKDEQDVPDLNLRGDEYTEYIIPALIRCGAIPKKDLKDGHFYYGKYRNSNVGKWVEDKNKFEIYRYKFQQFILDKCNHFEDDDNFALFVPIKEVTEEDYNKNG